MTRIRLLNSLSLLRFLYLFVANPFWLSWLIAVFSLFIVGLTVSRGTLIAFAIAFVVAFRKQLRRGFVPILLLVSIASVAFGVGMFDQAILHYTERGAEDTGRLTAWPFVIQRFFGSPLQGVGLANQVTEIPEHPLPITPHNGVLFIALVSGAVPLFFFLAYWVKGLRGALRAWAARTPESAYLLPLFIYSLLIDQSNNQATLEIWSVVTMCLCLHQLTLLRARRRGTVLLPITKRQRTAALARHI